MKDNKRKSILETAEKLFNRFSIKKTAVDDIAAQAKVAKGTIYNYFGDKHGIIKELIDEKISDFEDRINKAFLTINNPVEKIKITIKEHIRTLINTPFLADKELGIENESTQFILDEFDASKKNIIARVVDEAISKNLLPESDKNRIINTIRFTVKGIEQSIKNRLNINHESIDNDIDYLINLISKSNKKTGTSK